jgi:mannose-1-phosphate guanylyltransferase
MPAMILCAGLGTRLLPLTSWVAKPLVPVGDRPVLAHILERVRGFGGPVVINAHHHAEQFRAFLEREAPKVLLSYEKELLDTGGGVRQGLAVLSAGAGAGAGARASASASAGARADAGASADTLVWNGDSLIDIDLPALCAAHSLTPGSAGATLVVGPSGGGGNIGLDVTGRVVRIRRETVLPGEVRGVDFLCIQIIGRDLSHRLPERGGLVEAFYLPLLTEGVVLRAWETSAPFHDIGTLPMYLAANLAWLAARGLPSFVADGAHVAARVTLDRSIVGQGASIEGEGSVSRCVVWPGARTVAPLEGAIVTPFGVVLEPPA